MTAEGLVKTHRKFGARGVEFIGLTPEDESEVQIVQAFVDDFGIRWPIGYGAQSTIDALGVFAFPTIIVIGADGKVIWNDEQRGDLDSAIEQALMAAND